MDWVAAGRRAVAGRLVVVTGASSGVGRAFVDAMAPAGASFVLLARRRHLLDALAERVVAAGSSARVQAVDLRDPDAAGAAARAVLEHGVPDVVVANAGHSIARTALACAERPDSIARTAALNYTGAVTHLLPFLPGMVERGSGTVVGVTTANARLAVPGWGPYQASKAAFDMWLRCASEELRPSGVRVSTVALPLVRTPMSRPTYGERPLGALSPERAAAWIARAVVTGTSRVAPPWTRPAEIAAAIAPVTSARLVGLASRRLGGS